MRIRDFIEGMPKADLHMHIEGALEPNQKFELAERNGLSLPYGSVEDVIASYDFNDLPSFLAARYEGDAVLVTERDFYELAMSYSERLAWRISSTQKFSSIPKLIQAAVSTSRLSLRVCIVPNLMQPADSGSTPS